MGESWAGELHDWWFSLVVYVVENGFCCYDAVLILWGNIDVGYICTIILNTVHVVVGDENTRRRCCGRRNDVATNDVDNIIHSQRIKNSFASRQPQGLGFPPCLDSSGLRKSIGLKRPLSTIKQRTLTCTISIVRRNHMNMGAGAFAGHTTKPVLSAQMKITWQHQSLTPSIILQTCHQTWEFNQWSSWW